MVYDSTSDTMKHIQEVKERIIKFRDLLWLRLTNHDKSKLEEPEKSGLDKFVPRFKEVEFGTDEYYQILTEMKKVTDHHYANNTHHPEHFPDGVAGMNLLDIVEMFCDWKAVSIRDGKDTMEESIKICVERFGIEPQLARILYNTSEKLNW